MGTRVYFRTMPRSIECQKYIVYTRVDHWSTRMFTSLARPVYFNTSTDCAFLIA